MFGFELYWLSSIRVLWKKSLLCIKLSAVCLIFVDLYSSLDGFQNRSPKFLYTRVSTSNRLVESPLHLTKRIEWCREYHTGLWINSGRFYGVMNPLLLLEMMVKWGCEGITNEQYDPKWIKRMTKKNKKAVFWFLSLQIYI